MPVPDEREEFRTLGPVQNAVNTHAGEVVDSFESDTAFGKLFRR